MRKVFLFGAGYYGDVYFEDYDGGKTVYIPAAWDSPRHDLLCEFWVTGCVIQGKLFYIGVHGEQPDAETIQKALGEILTIAPQEKRIMAPKPDQINFRDPRQKSYTSFHATEEVNVLVFGEGWNGETLFVEPYWHLYLATREEVNKIKTFGLESYSKRGSSIIYTLAICGERPSREIIDGAIDRL